LIIWLKVACGAFSGQHFVARRQKAWFLPAAPMQGACGALAAISADNATRTRAKSVVFAGCVGGVRLRRPGGPRKLPADTLPVFTAAAS
jgi:hypothetical protein